jgi:hypothetical protein
MIRNRLVLERKRFIEKVEHDEKLIDLNQAQSVDSLVDSFRNLSRLIQSNQLKSSSHSKRLHHFNDHLQVLQLSRSSFSNRRLLKKSHHFRDHQ